MTTAQHYYRTECLMDKAREMGFDTRPTLDHIELYPVPEKWPTLTADTLRRFDTVEEALAWLDGLAWAQFIKRSKHDHP